MSLRFNAAEYLSLAIASRATYPVTLAVWLKSEWAYSSQTYLSAGDSGAELYFHAAELVNDRTRAISFTTGDAIESAGAMLTSDDGYHLMIVRVTGTTIQLILDNVPSTAVANVPSAGNFNLLTIGRTANSETWDLANAWIEHAMVWDAVLTDAECAQLYNRSVAPSSIQSASFSHYVPLVDSLLSAVGPNFTPTGLSSPVYESSGIVYPGGGASTYSVTYAGNGATGGSVPVDSGEYAENDTATVLGNTGSLVRPGYSFNGWNTAANGSGTAYAPGATFSMPAENVTLYAVWVRSSYLVNHENFDECDNMSAATITAASALKVVFEHASTGQDIVGDSDTDCSAGQNYDNTEDCGLRELHAINSRYNCDRLSLTEYESLDPTWFSTHSGLQSWRRNNPPPSTKLSQFLGMASNVLSAIDVAMYKYCWIDVWPETTGYVSDGAAYAASEISQRETFEAENPDVIMPYWTMPLESTESFPQRDAYNDAIRTYCAANDKWLIDMADIENYTTSDVKVTDVGGYDTADASYTQADGGHLVTAGRLRMARAYWTLLGLIVGQVTYHLSDVTRDNSGNILGGCQVSLFKHAGSGVYSFIATQVSDATTGAYDFTGIADNDPDYFITSRKIGSPNVFDCTDSNLQPEV